MPNEKPRKVLLDKDFAQKACLEKNEMLHTQLGGSYDQNNKPKFQCVLANYSCCLPKLSNNERAQLKSSALHCTA